MSVHACLLSESLIAKAKPHTANDELLFGLGNCGKSKTAESFTTKQIATAGNQVHSPLANKRSAQTQV